MPKLHYKEVNYKYTTSRDHIDNLGMYGYECETDFIRLNNEEIK